MGKRRGGGRGRGAEVRRIGYYLLFLPPGCPSTRNMDRIQILVTKNLQLRAVAMMVFFFSLHRMNFFFPTLKRRRYP